MTLPKHTDEALIAAAALRTNMDFAARSRWRIRAIMNGGPQAIQALVGDVLDDEGRPIEDLPWANWLYSALTKLAQKVGQMPKTRVDPANDSDDQAPRDRAEAKREAVEGYDKLDRMEMQLPQVGRWLPGYGYSVWTIGARRNPEGIPYPKATLRDPFDCYPGEWGVEQQPSELAVHRIVPIDKAIQMWPEAGEDLKKISISKMSRLPGGAVLLGRNSTGWENQRGRGVAVVEYYDDDGVHVLIPAIERRVDFISNPLDSGPMFVVPKRFAFDQLIGQYDHTFGLMAAGAKINALSIIAMEDGVFTETNVYGEVVGGKKYRKGRNAVNVLTPGSKVDKPQSNIPYQMFETINRIERQFRNVASYPLQDDAQSPLSFATGAGLEELLNAVSLEVREYHKVIRFGLQDVDSKRLEWDEKVSPNRRKPVGGKNSSIPKVKTYKPSEDFQGDYETRRAFGLMAGWDDSTKIVGGLQMLEAKVLDPLTFQENIEGFDDITQMNERIQDREARESLMRSLVARAERDGDVRAIMALIEMLPESEFKEQMRKFYTPQDPQMSPEEEEFVTGQPSDPVAQLFQGGGQPNVTTVLSRLTGSGGQGGVQTVGRL